MLPPGDASGSGGGLIGYICEARREADVDEWWELGACADDEVPPLCPFCACGVGVTFRGDAGTEVISGAIVMGTTTEVSHDESKCEV